MVDFNEISKYRLYSRERGVIGPPGVDADSIVRVDLFSENKVIEWVTVGAQEVDCLDAELQEFADHGLAWETMVENNWFDLLSNTHPTRSNNPKFILLTGLPGSGKTTLAKNLSSKLGWLHFDFADFALQVIGASPLMTNDYRQVGILAEKKINDAVKNGVSVIYDTTSLSVEMRQHHLDAVEFTNAKYIVYVPTDPETCLKRVSLRQPASSIDIRDGIYRSNINYIRTFWDYVDDYVISDNCISANNVFDANGVLEQLHQ